MPHEIVITNLQQEVDKVKQEDVQQGTSVSELTCINCSQR